MNAYLQDGDCELWRGIRFSGDFGRAEDAGYLWLVRTCARGTVARVRDSLLTVSETASSSANRSTRPAGRADGSPGRGCRCPPDAETTLDFYVPNQLVVRRAVTLLGAANSSDYARATVKVPPVPVVVRQRRHRGLGESGEWPLAHPVFVALDLAQDAGRGRQILNSWQRDDHLSEVWTDPWTDA